ncbi:hypothetical protein FEM48_Zijuj04G0103300 [Ziziphus jujuba var. spinosa]|uniref:Uncharacterized protein n=1 Tax=Ziziphus jujuba var. spinosa TaxID=714518 RepID=A0A978VJB5_ZIZJJ|nr:hypothetical protein FEM48_Zijuj04G0103300 [Ziziphus jujuba var. spinosa]
MVDGEIEMAVRVKEGEVVFEGQLLVSSSAGFPFSFAVVLHLHRHFSLLFQLDELKVEAIDQARSYHQRIVSFIDQLSQAQQPVQASSPIAKINSSNKLRLQS